MSGPLGKLAQVQQALDQGLKRLAARGLVEWGYHCVMQTKLTQADRYIARAQRIYRELSLWGELEELFLTRTQILMRAASWEEAREQIQVWIKQVKSKHISIFCDFYGVR